MKKEYTRPELNIVSLVVEDVTNDLSLGKDDNRLSIGGDLSDLFGSNEQLHLFFVNKEVFYQAAYRPLIFQRSHVGGLFKFSGEIVNG